MEPAVWHIGAMEGASSRRGFLRSLVRESAKGATEASRLLNVPGLPLPPRHPPPPQPVRRPDPDLDRAKAATGTVTLDELRDLAGEHGLEDHLDEIAALARHSVRLTTPTLQDDPVGAWLFEPTEGLLDESVWPLWEGERLTLVAQLDLTDPALRDVDLPLPVDGRLLVLWAAVQAPSGQLAAHAGAARVLHVPSPDGRPAPATRLSVELTLPRVWAAPVQALGLDPIEHDGYLRLRRLVATMQDVEFDDGFGRPVAYHRVLGYPNETGGLMPLTCELTASGRDATDLDTADDDVGARAGRWRLLAQLTAGAEGPWNLGGEPGRLYVWITDDDLRAGDFSRVRAIAQPGL
jgi:hypothetical protein